jgi:hypothetical protein
VDAWDRLRGSALERNETTEFLHELAVQFRAEMAD